MSTEVQLDHSLSLHEDRAPSALTLEEFSFRYKGKKEPVLSSLNFQINKGEFILIMGQSGCGKSTLVQTFNGVIPHLVSGKLEGRVISMGKDTRQVKPNELAREISIVFQNPEVQLFALTVEDEVSMVLENMGMDPLEMRQRVNWALSITGLQGFEMRQPARLSGGQKQRVATAAILSYHPSVLILDEPTAYLDNQGTVSLLTAVRNLVRQREMTIILVEHKIELVIDLVDRVIVMDKGGVLFDGSPQEVFSNVDILRGLGVSLPRAITIGVRLKDLGLPLGMLPPTVSGLAEALRELAPGKSFRPPHDWQSQRTPPPSGKPVLEFQNVRFTYESGGTTAALDGVSTTIQEGDFVAIVGHNGSGKSTLLQHTVGILTPTEGRVRVDGKDTRSASVSELARTVGIVFQNPDHQIFNETIYDEIAYGPRNFGLAEEEIPARVKEVLELVDLVGTEKQDPENLSMGQRQRLAVASVLVMQPRVLALDEPTVGQDPYHLTLFMEMIRQWNRQGNTVVMITHDIDFAIEYASRVIVMAHGQILADGPPEEIFRRIDLLEKAGVEAPAIIRLAQDLFGDEAPPISTEQEVAALIAGAYFQLSGG